MMSVMRAIRKKFLILAAFCIFAWGLYYFVEWYRNQHVYRFDDVSGPAEKTVVPDEGATPWTQFDHGGPGRLAILLTDPGSSWLGLAHGLKTIGVPFRITRDYREAVKHKAVLVYPNISGASLDAVAIRALATFARERGTLIGSHVLGGGMNELFGFDEAIPAKHTSVKFDNAQAMALTFTDPNESTIVIGNAAVPESLVGTYGYTRPLNPPLAVFEDGTAAVTQKKFASGRAYALGMDLGFMLAKGYNNREEGIARSYVNGFEPSLDVLLRLVKNIYLEANPDAVTLSTVPFGKSLAAIISHDIDYTRSLKNALTYAEFERSQNISATHFIQVKYIKDWNDDIFFNAEGVKNIAALSALGAEVASHSVSHSKVMSKFALGSGAEQYPAYQPFVKSKMVTTNASVLGELRVSKFLLDKFTLDSSVISFRPGHLQNPYTLPQALKATGFRYSSSVTANNSLTHLPFQLTYNRAQKQEMDVFEFPVTLEDEAIIDGAAWLDTSVVLSKKLSRYGGTFMVLIHTNVIDYKFAFERDLITAIKPYSWFGSLREFGGWWSARNVVECDVENAADGQTVTLNVPKRISGLTLNLPMNMRVVTTEPAALKINQSGNSVVIDSAEGVVKLRLAKLK
jgi:hypothetical protein